MYLHLNKMSHLADKMLVSFPEVAGVSVFCGVLLVQRDVRLLALCSQGQTALLQLRLGVIPVLVQNELLQHTNPNKARAWSNYFYLFHKLFSKNRKYKWKSAAVSNSLSHRRSCFYFILGMTLSNIPPPKFALTYLLSPWLALSICVFSVSTNHRLLKTKANPRPDIKSVWESPRCAALIHFSYPRGTSKSPSINKEAALS